VSGFAFDAFGELPFGEEQPIDDLVPPDIYNFSPFVGAEIGRLDTIEFDVVDDSGEVETVLVTVVFADGTLETVWTDHFAETYRRGSARTPIVGGYHFVIRRTRGWPGSTVRVNVTATDLAGNVGRGQSS
jgi:hypothetical protein